MKKRKSHFALSSTGFEPTNIYLIFRGCALTNLATQDLFICYVFLKLYCPICQDISFQSFSNLGYTAGCIKAKICTDCKKKYINRLIRKKI